MNIIFASLLVLLSHQLKDVFAKDVVDCTSFPTTGQYEAKFFETTWEGTIFWGYLPNGAAAADGKLPLVVFHHGSSGIWEFYEANLKMYAENGFVVVFPFIKNPEEDAKGTTLSNDGEFVIKGLQFAVSNLVSSDSFNADWNPQGVVIDPNQAAIVGHSMGATSTIMAAYKLFTESSLRDLMSKITVKVAIAQHPGICGPFGPPPVPYTWTKKQLKVVRQSLPLFLTTATNDAAFWRAPYTAKYEYNCYMGSNYSDKDKSVQFDTAFIEFSEEACLEDKARDPYLDGGHNCPLKAGVETPWTLQILKLYAQLEGWTDSECYRLIWDLDDADALKQSGEVNKIELYPAAVPVSIEDVVMTEETRIYLK